MCFGLKFILFMCLTLLVCASERCLAPNPCFFSAPWAELGKRVEIKDVQQLPLDEWGYASPRRADPLWLADQPEGMQYGGHMPTRSWSGWALTNSTPAKVAILSNAEEASIALRFAAEHALGISVKNTGHSFYGRSSARGTLSLWTHRIGGIHWNSSFTPSGCKAPVDEEVVSVGAGVQFWELYNQAQTQQRFVMGGTAGSVGPVGCTLGGCYGDYSRMYGSGATNLVEAEVVLANGSIVTASACNEHAELFKALRGGGGAIALVTKMSYRTHPWPEAGKLGTVSNAVAKLQNLSLASSVETFFVWYADIVRRGLAKHFGGQAFVVGRRGLVTKKPLGFVKLSLVYLGLTQNECQELIKPLGPLVACQVNMDAQLYPPGDSKQSNRGSAGWYSGYEHPLGYILQAKSRYFKLSNIEGDALQTFSQNVAELAMTTPKGTGLTIALNYALGRGSPKALQDAADTSVHPDVYEAVGAIKLLSGYWNENPWLPIPLDSFVPVGDSVSVPATEKMSADAAAAMLDELLPDAAAYFCEDVSPGWRQRYWGAGYSQLLGIKHKLDPLGLFECAYCIGSNEHEDAATLVI